MSAPPEGEVRLEVTPPVAILTFDRPGKLNAFTSAMVEQLAAAVEALQSRADVRAVVLTGSEGAFTTGADQRMVAARLDRDFGDWLSRSVADALDALEASERFTVAVVGGVAYGAGAEIMLACDYRIAEPSARIAFMQSRNGLVPAWGGGPRLVRELGQRKALALLLTGRVFDAEEAFGLGLIDELAEQGQGLNRGLEVARDVAGRAPEVLRALRAVTRDWARLPDREGRAEELRTFLSLWGGPAHREATSRWR